MQPVTQEKNFELLRYLMASNVFSSPHHPASNGVGEYVMQIVKSGVKKVLEGNSRLAKILFAYCVTLQSTK